MLTGTLRRFTDLVQFERFEKQQCVFAPDVRGGTTYELPQPDLRYVSINGQTVLVNAETGVIVRVLR